jgi:hypothetical protein
MKYTPIKDSLIEMGESFIKLGIVDNLKKAGDKDKNSQHGDDDEKKKKN